MYTKAQHSFFLWNVCNSLYYRKTLIVLKHPLPPPIFRQKNPENGAYLTCAEIRFRSSVTLKTDKNGRLFRKPFGIPNTELNGVPKNGAICQFFVYHSDEGFLQNRNESGIGGSIRFLPFSS